MYLVDEIAHEQRALRDDIVTEFFFTDDDSARYKVVETAHHVEGADHTVRFFTYDVSIWTPNGWMSVVQMDQVHADDATIAAKIAANLIGGESKAKEPTPPLDLAPLSLAIHNALAKSREASYRSGKYVSNHPRMTEALCQAADREASDAATKMWRLLYDLAPRVEKES